MMTCRYSLSSPAAAIPPGDRWTSKSHRWPTIVGEPQNIWSMDVHSSKMMCIYIYYIYIIIYIYNPVLFDSKMHNLGGFFANGSLRRIFWGLKKSQWISTDHCTGCCCGENPGFWKHKQKRFPMVPVIFHLNHVWDTNHSKRWNTWPPKRWEMLSSAW